jgi:hypothetical protein
MKTTMHLHHDSAPVTPATRVHVPPATLRLGLVLSPVAAVLAVVVEALVDLPVVVILVPVAVLGFVLSWHASGRPGTSRER